MIDIACTQIDYPEKGEDTYVVRKVGNSYLLAVADGLSMDNGRAAARWAKEYLDGISHIQSARCIFDALKVALSNDPNEYERSETTLTCGILTESESSGGLTLRFDFFAIGDSPIWKVVSTCDSKYPYQRYLIHGEPYPAETSKVYSTLRLKEREIKGVVSFGSVDLSVGEVLVVCSDGIPEREVMVRDLSATVQSNQPKLCEWLFDSASYEDASLQNVLNGYRGRELLFDDATLIVARLAMQPIGGGVEPAQESFSEGDDEEDLSVDETTEGGKNNLIPSTRDGVSAIDTVESVQPKRGE